MAGLIFARGDERVPQLADARELGGQTPLKRLIINERFVLHELLALEDHRDAGRSEENACAQGALLQREPACRGARIYKCGQALAAICHFIVRFGIVQVLRVDIVERLTDGAGDQVHVDIGVAGLGQLRAHVRDEVTVPLAGESGAGLEDGHGDRSVACQVFGDGD